MIRAKDATRLALTRETIEGAGECRPMMMNWNEFRQSVILRRQDRFAPTTTATIRNGNDANGTQGPPECSSGLGDLFGLESGAVATAVAKSTTGLSLNRIIRIN
jgi:hypothetical protein